jgi:hypothetical protein
MKKEHRIGIRVNLPEIFITDVRNEYEHVSGAYQAISFSSFMGLLIGMGLEAYRKTHRETSAVDDESWSVSTNRGSCFTPVNLSRDKL